MGRTDRAIVDLKVAVDLDPLDFRALLNLSNMLLQTGNIKDAEVMIQRALALNPSSPEARQILQAVSAQRQSSP